MRRQQECLWTSWSADEKKRRRLLEEAVVVENGTAGMVLSHDLAIQFTYHRCECLWQVLSLPETDDANHRPACMHHCSN